MKPFEQELNSKVNALPRETVPDKDLWPAIERSIATPSSSIEQKHQHQKPVFTTRWLAVAAGVTVIALSALLLPHATDPWQQKNDQIVEVMSAQQQQQVQSLLARYQDSPALTNDWQSQLDELSDAATAIKKALKEDPNNAALIRMLHHVYQQQIALIERVHAPKWQQI